MLVLERYPAKKELHEPKTNDLMVEDSVLSVLYTYEGVLIHVGTKLPRSSPSKSWEVLGKATMVTTGDTLNPGNHGNCRGNHPLLWPQDSGYPLVN